MKNSDYWRRRAEILEAMKNQSAGSYTAAVNQQFNLAQKKLDEQIEQWYGRFAKNNEITLLEARQWLTGKDLAEFKWDVTEYIKYGKDAMIDPAFIKQLENASARFHISKLEALKLKTQNTVEQLYGKTAQQTNSLFGQIYTDNYYHTAFTLQQGFGIGWDIAALNPHQIESVLSKPWTLDKQTFSDRLWTQKQSLLDEVHTRLTQNLLLGKAPDEAISAIAKKFNTSKSNAGRLVMTESAYFANEAQRNAFNSLDVEEFEVIGTLDGETCEICGGLDGSHLPMSQYETGVTAPPFHPWCRCCTAPYFPDDEGERFARDEDESAYYIPSDMSYKDWKDKFVNGGDKSGLTPIDNGGVVSWVKDIPVQPEPEKKEYLTKKKLESKLSDIETEMNELEVKNGNNILTNGSSDDIAKYFDLDKQKTEYQSLLDKKILTEQKKALTKQEITLQTEFDNLEVKSYSGIWKDDVSTADWNAKKGSIQAKKDYFQQQLNAASPDDVEKWEKLLADLEDFNVSGQHYHEIQSELQKVQTSLTSLKKNGIIKGGIDETFSQARKDAALWAQSGREADDKLREMCGEVWQNATKAQRQAIYDYTCGSGGFNRPLRGYQGGWGEYSFKGIGNVDLDYEGKASAIKHMTEIINKSSYDFDVWLQRGVENSAGASGFLQISESQLRNLNQSELEKLLLDKVITDEAFFSCGSAKGQGFSGSYVFNVYCPQGTKMMYTEPFSYYGNGAKLSWDGVSKQSSFGYEDETIIQRGTSFKITKIEQTGSRTYFDIEVVSQP